MRTNLAIIVLLQLISIYSGQRVAPGVPPQHYQQHVPQQMHQVPIQQQQMHQVPIQGQQHQQQQMHQVPVQQQQMHQVPVQHQQQQQQLHQQQPQQMHQVPVQHGHHGGPHGGQILNAANIVNEKDHIAEHMEVPMDTSKMSEQELQFHYFKMHDADNNNKLDGCELIKSLIHWHGVENKDGPQIQTDEEFSTLIDQLLLTMDLNLDGYVDYVEFKKEMDE